MHRLVILFAALLGGCATSHANRTSEPTKTTTERSTGQLRVMTFNIQSARHGLDAVAGVIREQNPDVVALQEVDKETVRSGRLDQARELARRAGYEHQRHFRATDLAGGAYGVAVLSKHPIKEALSWRLPTTRGLEPRTVARTVLDVDGREVSLYVTHLTNMASRSDLRARQAMFISRLMAEDGRAAIVVGDLNDDVDSPALLLLRRRMTDAFTAAGRGAAETYPLPVLPDLRLDYVLSTKELRPARAFVVRKVASDHFPLVADFDFAGTTGVQLADGTGPTSVQRID